MATTAGRCCMTRITRKGHLFVLVVPENFSDFYNYPAAALNEIRRVLSLQLPVRLEAPSKVSACSSTTTAPPSCTTSATSRWRRPWYAARAPTRNALRCRCPRSVARLRRRRKPAVRRRGFIAGAALAAARDHRHARSNYMGIDARLAPFATLSTAPSTRNRRGRLAGTANNASLRRTSKLIDATNAQHHAGRQALQGQR